MVIGGISDNVIQIMMSVYLCCFVSMPGIAKWHACRLLWLLIKTTSWY